MRHRHGSPHAFMGRARSRDARRHRIATMPRAAPPHAPKRAHRAVAAVIAIACSGGDDPKAMRNLGEECVSCHRAGAKAAEWPFTAGGTIYRTAVEPASPGLGGVAIVLTDSAGKVVRLRSNAAGN